tara:strand:- start:12 stop:206 length:195 start_codon:yes stop_codon:yes gene_type:complete
MFKGAILRARSGVDFDAKPTPQSERLVINLIGKLSKTDDIRRHIGIEPIASVDMVFFAFPVLIA